MGYWKNFQLFCQDHRLDAEKPSSHDIYEAACRGLSLHAPNPEAMDEIDDPHALSWDIIEHITGGCSGTHYTRCPNCGWDKERNNNTFTIDRTLVGAQGHCFYCGLRGETSNPEGVPDHLVKTERRLVAEQKARKKSESIAFALKLWEESEPITTNWLVAVYLEARRLELPPNPDAVLRFHWQCPFGEKGKLPCMVALLRDAVTDKPTGIHRTHFISANHGEAERMVLGTLSGSAVKLWPLGSSDTLAVGEGIENVLSAIQLGQGDPPAWAATVAGNLPKLPVINGVKHLTIQADNDESRTGEIAARELRRKWKAAGKDVVIRIPIEIGRDFNDLLRSAS